MKYLLFNPETNYLIGFYETLNNDTSINGRLVQVSEFPLLAEGTTLQLNADNTWSEIALPAIETTPPLNPEPTA